MKLKFEELRPVVSRKPGVKESDEQRNFRMLRRAVPRLPNPEPIPEQFAFWDPDSQRMLEVGYSFSPEFTRGVILIGCFVNIRWLKTWSRNREPGTGKDVEVANKSRLIVRIICTLQAHKYLSGRNKWYTEEEILKVYSDYYEKVRRAKAMRDTKEARKNSLKQAYSNHKKNAGSGKTTTVVDSSNTASA